MIVLNQQVNLKGILELSALILAIINGLMLLRFYLRDRPKLTVHPVHPNIYQWWFKLPVKENQGNPTRKYGFLAYLDIANKGLRKVSLESWELHFKTLGFRKIKLKAISIPEPVIDIAESTIFKVLPVLGQKGLMIAVDSVIEPGTSKSGVAYYYAEFYGDEAWNPKIVNGRITGKIVIRDIFGKKKKCKIVFSEKPLEKVLEIIENLDKIK